jgi:hypothetical protein
MVAYSYDANNDLFVRLAAYRPSERRNSFENFFTELVAYVLRVEPDARRGFLQSILGGSASHDFSKFNVNTQCTHKDMRFDLVISTDDESNRRMVIVENKIDSSLSKLQLDRYLAFASEKAGRTVVILAKTPQVEANRARDATFGGQVLWSQIAEVWSKSINNRSRLMDNVLEFMRRSGMGPFEPLMAGEIEALGYYGRFKEKINALVAKIADRIPDRELVLTASEITERRPLISGGYNGIGWWAPVDKSSSKADFWYFIGFTSDLPNPWWPALSHDGEPEALVFIGLWGALATQSLQDNAKRLLTEADFEMQFSQNQSGFFLIRRRPLRDFLGLNSDRITEFLLDSHLRIQNSGELPKIYEAFRKAKNPQIIEEKDTAS